MNPPEPTNAIAIVEAADGLLELVWPADVPTVSITRAALQGLVDLANSRLRPPPAWPPPKPDPDQLALELEAAGHV